MIAGKVPAELLLDVREAAAARKLPELLIKLDRFDKSLAAEDVKARYRDVLSGGDPRIGHRIFYEKAEVSCVRCHRINWLGGMVGPDLTEVGTRQSRDQILESILDPNKVIAPGYESILLFLKDGDVVGGVLKSENEASITLRTPTDDTVTIAKDKVRTRKKDLSAMPQNAPRISLAAS